MILSVWENNHGSLVGLEMKKEGEKSKTPRDRVGRRAFQSQRTTSVPRGLRVAPSRTPQPSLCVMRVGAPIFSY